MDTIIVKCIPVISGGKIPLSDSQERIAVFSGEKARPVDTALFDKAVHAVLHGELVAFPTETVYGLGANALDATAVHKIFEAKGRPADNPLIVHLAAKDQIGPLVRTISPLAKKCIDAFMPGPITLVFEKSDRIPYEVTAGLDTVAIRIPSHPVAHLFLEKAGIPVAAPSANVSGKPSTTTAKHVYDDLKGKIPFIIDGGASDFGVESTVVNVTGEIPVILRPGAVTPEQIFHLCGAVSGIGSGVLEHAGTYESALNQNTKGTPMSPGMKYRHYAPRAKVVLADAPSLVLRIEAMEALIETAIQENKKVGVFACDEMIAASGNRVYASTYGPSGNVKAASAKLFFALREMDEAGVDLIIAEALPIKGMGIAYMNRLLKSAGISTKEKE